MGKMKVAVLGATGLVGQRIISIISKNPDFEVTEVCASKRSAGKPYAGAADWKMPAPIPDNVKDLVVKLCEPKGIDVDVVLSALPSKNAREVEPRFAKAGFAVSSNASAFRMDPLVPLIVPEINADHLGLIEQQKKVNKWDGFIVTDPNCTTIAFSIPLSVVYVNYGLDYSFMVSMQALSGMGLPGLSFDLNDNVLPYIKGEEPKVDTEIQKILGEFDGAKIKEAGFPLYSACNRVNVTDGHLETLFCKTREVVDLSELKRAFESVPPVDTFTSPNRPVVVEDKSDRPQPKLDRDREKGMSITVGRLKQYDDTLVRFHTLAHNAIRGAAGAAVVNAELLKKEKYI